jgi:flagellar biogenesis protein FliO
MEIIQSKLARIEIMPTGVRTSAPDFFTLTMGRLKVLSRSVFRAAGRTRKALSVRETAALGDRRFVSVIQFERQRFLVGSSPTSVTLLAQLPDQPGIGDQCGKACGEDTGQPGKREERKKESEENN